LTVRSLCVFSGLLGLLSIPLTIAACSGSDTGVQPIEPDAGFPTNDAGTDANADSGKHDDAGDAGPKEDAGDAGPQQGDDAGDAGPQQGDDAGDAGPQGDAGDAGDAAPPPPEGELVYHGTGYNIQGVLSDGNIVVRAPVQSGTDTLFEVPFVGSGPRFIHHVPSNTRVRLDGASVLMGSPVPLKTPASEVLAVWNQANGFHTISDSTFESAAMARVSPDGTQVAYVETSATSPKSAVWTLKVASTADGTQGPALTSMYGLGNDFGFASNGTFILDYASTSTGFLDSIGIFPKGAGPAVHVTAHGSQADPTGTWLWTYQDDGSGTLVRASDGKTVLTEPKWQPGKFDANGTSLVFQVDGAIKRVALSTTAPVVESTLVANGVMLLDAISPDGKTAIYETQTELDAISLAPGSAPLKLASTPTEDAAFTPGGGHVLFKVPTAAGDMMLCTVPVAGGPVTSTVALRYRVIPVGPESVVVDGSDRTWKLVNAADGSSKPVLSNTDYAVFPSPDGKWLAYATAVAPSGLYRVSLQ
jgi:hypothetical protein